MRLYSADGLLLDILVREVAVSTWLESNRLLVWIHADSQEVLDAKEMLGLERILILLPETRTGIIRIIADPARVPLSGDIIYLN